MAGQAHHADDLDALLDSALDDFQTLNLSSSSSRSVDGAEKKQEVASLPSGVQGLGMGLPDLRSKKDKRKQKAPKDDSNHAAETLDKLRQQTREAVKGLESLAGGDDLGNEMMEDWVKQFGELTGSQDMESMVETMMQQLLSKEILHEPMKEIGEKYPKWLADHEGTLNEEDLKRYTYQYELIKELNEVYENDANNYDKIVVLMQKMQECGQPPNDIVREVAPDFDMSSLGMLSPEMLDPSQPSCCVM